MPKQKLPITARSARLLSAVDEILVDHEARRKHSYRQVRRMLNSVPRKERGVDWVERIVTLYCAHKMRVSRCAALKRQIVKIRLEKNQLSELQGFNERVYMVSSPYVLANHGLCLPFRARNQIEVARDLRKLILLLKHLGFCSFINSGTLLGAVREGGFISHDDDADLAVLIDGESDKNVVESIMALLQKLNESGSLVKDAWLHKSGPVIKVLVGSGVEVDLFPVWFRGDKAYIWPHTFGELGYSDIFPLSELHLCNEAMPAPCHPEKMLEINYGVNWRTPDPDFFFSWDHAKKRFSSVLKQYKIQHIKYFILTWLKLYLRIRT